MVGGKSGSTAAVAAPQEVTWIAMLNRTLCLGVAVLIGAAALVTSTVLFGDLGARKQPWVWVLFGTQVFLAASFVLYSRRPTNVVDQVITLFMTSVGVVASASLTWTSWTPSSAESRQLLPAAAMAIQLVSITLIIRRFGWVLVAVALSVSAGLWLTHQSGSATMQPEEWLLPFSFWVSTIILVRVLRAAARDAARLSDRRREIRANVIAHSNAEVADDEGRRLIHDRVIGALTKIAAGSDPDRAAVACENVIKELTLLDPTTTTIALRDALTRERNPRVRVTGEDWRISPPPRVITALRESAEEAIRNVARHAGVDNASVVLSATPLGQVVVEIRDTGQGFDPTEMPGFGLSQSITARMGQVGGQARIESAPGMGTTVRLTWPHQMSLRTPEHVGVLAPGRRARMYVAFMVPAVLAMFYLAIYHAEEMTYPGLSVALACVMAVGMLAAALYVGRGDPAWWAVLLAMACNSAMTVAVLSISPSGTIVKMGVWVITAAAMVVGSFALEAKPIQVVLMALSQSVTVAALAYLEPGVGTFEPVGALLVPVAIGAMSFAVGALLRHGSRLVAVQEALANAELEEIGWLESAQTARRRYAEQLLVNVMPFIRLVASDRPPSTETLRTRAAALAAQCRDLLALSDVMPPVVREGVLRARSHGVRVAIRDGSSTSPVAWALLTATLKHASEVDAVTLIPARTNTPARVTVIPPLTAHTQEAIRGELGEQNLWIEHTEVTTSLILVSPEWGTSSDDDKDLGFSP